MRIDIAFMSTRIGLLLFTVAALIAQSIHNSRTTTEISGRTTLEDAFSRTLRGTGFSGGIATAAGSCGTTEQDFHVPAGLRLADALGSLVSKAGNHKWKLQKDVIVILPLAGMPSLLQTRIHHIRISDQNNLTLALDELLQSPEVKESAANLHSVLRPPGAGFQKLNTAQTRDEKYPIDLRDLSLADALSYLSARHSNAVWSYDENVCEGQRTIRLDFISR